MSVLIPEPRETMSLLDRDPDLAAGLEGERLAVARAELVASVLRLPRGEWHPDRTPPAGEHLGLLLVDGLMVREIRVAGARGIELLGAGELLRPWDEDAASFVEGSWRVIEPVLMAELEPFVATRLSRYPAVLSTLVGRVMRRCRSIAALAAIESFASLEDRLLVLFWQLAELTGERAGDRVLVPLRLTHQMLADLVGARRPSVSLALGRLAEEGLVLKDEQGWQLPASPPALLLGHDGP